MPRCFLSPSKVWHVMIFLGMAFWYKETSTSFIAGFKNVCSGSDLLNETDTSFTSDGSSPDQDYPVGNLVKTFVKLIYLEEVLHFSLEEVFNIF